MSRKLIVLEGLDGSGKSTQFALLCNLMMEKQVQMKRVSFPDYAQPSSSLIKMYLGGEFGKNPEDVNAYAASSFYAVDRFASYKKFWKKSYEQEKMILSDRYTTSNMIYQMVKLPESEWEDFINWTEDFEYNKLGLPRPDKVIYLDMEPKISQRLLLNRYNGDESRKDLHERNIKFLERCRDAALFSAKKQGWHVIDCAEGGNPLPIHIIHKKITILFGEV